MSDSMDDNATPVSPEQSDEEIVQEEQIVDDASFDDFLNNESQSNGTVDVKENIEEKELEDEEEYEEESVLMNGLDPISTDLISSSNMQLVKSEDLNNVKVIVEVLEVSLDNEIWNRHKKAPNDEVFIGKVSREVKNLVISTNENSDIMKNLLLDTPRRTKKVIELKPDDEEDEDDKLSDKEISKSPSLERVDVSSTSDNRRESIKSNRGRSRSISKTRAPIKKKKQQTVVEMMRQQDEISTASDDMQDFEDQEAAYESEAFSEKSMPISMEGRTPNPPPKVSFYEYFEKVHNFQ